MQNQTRNAIEIKAKISIAVLHWIIEKYTDNPEALKSRGLSSRIATELLIYVEPQLVYVQNEIESHIKNIINSLRATGMLSITGQNTAGSYYEPTQYGIGAVASQDQVNKIVSDYIKTMVEEVDKQGSYIS